MDKSIILDFEYLKSLVVDIDTIISQSDITKDELDKVTEKLSFIASTALVLRKSMKG